MARQQENEELKAQARKKLDNAKRQFVNAERKVRSYIRTNPERAALIAAGIGAALGAAVMAVMKRKSH